jgi:SAM-dependent methyltransferase
MSSSIEAASYEHKHGQYFAHSRIEMRPFVPVAAKRILDVGCGRGTFSSYFKETRGAEVWGVELVAEAARAAEAVLDRAFCGEFGPRSGLPAGYFDAVICNDVLEHMLEPAEALRYARSLLTPGGAIVASLPNFLFWHNVREVVWKGDWRYRDEGILDRTHLRFFTRKSMLRLFEESGFKVEVCQGINPLRGGRTYQIVNALSGGRFADMRWQQFAIVARPV